MRIRATLIALGLLLVVAAAAAWYLLRPVQAPDPQAVDDSQAAREIAAATGELQPFEYMDLQQPQATSVGPGKIEVLEFFWYGCPHCYHFEPYIEAWKKSLPPDVVFIRVPADFNPLWEIHARAYYTAELLGILDQVHRPLFDAIHKEHRRLFSQQALAEYFTQFGVSASVFNNTYSSYAVNNRIAQAKQLVAAYHIDGVPTMIINGKYMTSVSITGSPASTIRVVNQLIAQER